MPTIVYTRLTGTMPALPDLDEARAVVATADAVAENNPDPVVVAAVLHARYGWTLERLAAVLDDDAPARSVVLEALERLGGAA